MIKYLPSQRLESDREEGILPKKTDVKPRVMVLTNRYQYIRF